MPVALETRETLEQGQQTIKEKKTNGGDAVQ
jgi:hypothetical protein